MTDEAALLRAICADPDEDTPRLAFADYLEERGDADRAVFIRGQVELATLKEDSLHRREVAFRCRQLLDANEERWLEPREAFRRDWAWSRGFVETFSTTPRELEVAHAELFSTYPFRRVWLSALEGKADGVSMLPPDNHITALDLIGNNLNVRELKKLAKATQLPHLRELGLMFNDLRDTSVKVLCGEPFFQRLELIRLGANPFTPRGRDQLRAHFGDRVTFAHEREPDRLYTVQDDRLTAGFGNDFTQLLVYGDAAVFDHAGSLLHFEVCDPAKFGKRNARDAHVEWLAGLGFQSATIKVKAFRFPTGEGITPFNWWAQAYDRLSHPQRSDVLDAAIGWLDNGQYRFDFGGDDNWFDRDGEVTAT